MERHRFPCAILLFFSSSLCAQHIQLENSWKRDSKFLYVGTDNRLPIKGDVKSINSIRCENAACRIIADTVFVNPRSPGSLEVELYTDQQKYFFRYTVKMLELPTVTINAPNSRGSILAKTDIDKASLKISSGKPTDDDFYENFLLDGFVIIVAGNRYYVKGNGFSPQVRTALNILSSGDSFSVEEIYLKNKENGFSQTVLMSFHFRIL
jgi:hypothetical protein